MPVPSNTRTDANKRNSLHDARDAHLGLMVGTLARLGEGQPNTLGPRQPAVGFPFVRIQAVDPNGNEEQQPQPMKPPTTENLQTPAPQQRLLPSHATMQTTDNRPFD